MAEEKVKFSAILLFADMPTQEGNIYTSSLCTKLAARLCQTPRIIIQEFNPVERRLKKVLLEEPWSKKIMADVIDAELIDNKLVFSAECRVNRDGKKLAGMIQSLGINSLEFVPVGYGVADASGMIGMDYRLNYIAVEPNNQAIMKR